MIAAAQFRNHPDSPGQWDVLDRRRQRFAVDVQPGSQRLVVDRERPVVLQHTLILHRSSQHLLQSLNFRHVSIQPVDRLQDNLDLHRIQILDAHAAYNLGCNPDGLNAVPGNLDSIHDRYQHPDLHRIQILDANCLYQMSCHLDCFRVEIFHVRDFHPANLDLEHINARNVNGKHRHLNRFDVVDKLYLCRRLLLFNRGRFLRGGQQHPRPDSSSCGDSSYRFSCGVHRAGLHPDMITRITCGALQPPSYVPPLDRVAVFGTLLVMSAFRSPVS